MRACVRGVLPTLEHLDPHLNCFTVEKLLPLAGCGTHAHFTHEDAEAVKGYRDTKLVSDGIAAWVQALWF